MESPQFPSQLVFGFPEEWERFHERQSSFLAHFPHLADATQAAFGRVIEISEPIERFVMLYGRLCVEDFYEILLCCGNGYGFAALKLLRGLYEKAVTLEYLNDHPNELSMFLDHRHVSDYKLYSSLALVFGEDVLPSELQQEVIKAYEGVKDNYMITGCSKCGTKKVNFTWTKLNFPAMAAQTRVLGKLIHSAYYVPMRHTHSTGAALIERLERNGEGLGFNPDASRSQADDALSQAHIIILEILHIQQKRFNIEGFEALYDRCVTDWKLIRGVDDLGNRIYNQRESDLE